MRLYFLFIFLGISSLTLGCATYPDHIKTLKDPERFESFIHSTNNLDELDRFKYSLLHYTTRRGDIKRVEALLKAGANPDVETRRGIRPLHLALWKGHKEIIRLLIEAGADINKKYDYNDWAPLHFVIANNKTNAEPLMLLLEYKPEIDPKTNNKHKYKSWTPLHIAAEVATEEHIKLLLRAGANPNETTEEGYSAVDIALARNKLGASLAKLLSEAGGKKTGQKVVLPSSIEKETESEEGSDFLSTALGAASGVIAARSGVGAASTSQKAGALAATSFLSEPKSPSKRKAKSSKSRQGQNQATSFAHLGGECARKDKMYSRLGEKISRISSHDECDLQKAKYLMHAWAYDLARECQAAGATEITAEHLRQLRSEFDDISRHMQKVKERLPCRSYHKDIQQALREWPI